MMLVLILTMIGLLLLAIHGMRGRRKSTLLHNNAHMLPGRLYIAHANYKPGKSAMGVDDTDWWDERADEDDPWTNGDYICATELLDDLI